MDINNLIETWHPKLKNNNYIIISDNNLMDYNCIAYSLDIYDMYCGSSTNSWPYKILSRSPKLDNYIKYYNMYDYVICDNYKYDNDFEKVALYVDNDNNVTHAAKQYKNRWRSKLGASVVIEHELDWISGFDYDNYGKVGIILKRKR